jgi:DNA/RNA endonuclease YhcR with UshA esterase domain
MEETLKFTTSDLTEYTHCPSCGKSTPKHSNSCHRCGASFFNRFNLKRLNLILGLIGLIGFGFLGYAYYEATHITPIEKINSNMENQTIIISGIITDINYDDRYEKTEFLIEDDSGSIWVYGWSEFSSDLKAANKIPHLGDELIIEGMVNVYESDWSTKISLEIESPNSFEINEIDPISVEIPTLIENYETYLKKKVTITGNVTNQNVGTIGNTLLYVSLTLTQDFEGITVFIDNDLLNFAEEGFILPNTTDYIQITGIVDLFNEELEVIPSSISNTSIKFMEVNSV